MARGKNPFKTAGVETPLRAWCEQTGTSVYAVARLVRVSYATAFKWHRGLCLPGLVLAFKLERVTKGGVPAESWLGTEIAKYQWSNDSNWCRWKNKAPSEEG